MAHRTRGHRSGTYEIQELVDVDTHALTITVRHAAAHQPSRYALMVEHSAAAEEMLWAMAHSIRVGSNGDADSGWESVATLRNAVFHARVMVERLHEAGFRTFADSNLDVPILRRLYAPFQSNGKRTACWLLARAVKENHPNGAAVSLALKNTRFAAEYGETFTYDHGLAEAIEAAARAVFRDAVEAQREVFALLGYDVTGRSWIHVPAEEVIERARRSHADVTKPEAPQPSVTAGETEQIAWIVTHPDAFGYSRGRPRRLVGRRIVELGRALYPDSVTVTAALIVHCLVSIGINSL